MLVFRGSERSATVEVVTLLLAAASGSLDALALLVLGRVFASVMTGNLVLLGVALPTDDGAQATAAGLALSGYVAAVVVGNLLTRPRGRTSEATVLCLEIVLIWLLVVVWTVRGGARPEGGVAHLLLVVAAAAMGLQSVVSGRLPGGPSTTYFTGTLTRSLAELTQHRRLDAWPAARLLALVCGAAVTALLVGRAPRFALSVPAVAVPVAAAMFLRSHRRRVT